MSISSLLTQLLYPTNLCVVLLIVATFLFLFRLRKTAASIAISGVLWVVAWSLPITSILIGGYLENLHPYQPVTQLPNAEAIVVLGGHTANSRMNWFDPIDSGTRTRVEQAAQVYAAQRTPTIIVSGAALDGGFSEAHMMARNLQQLGVPAAAIQLEDQSLNTRENALYSVLQLKEQGIRHILLVTSALHMPRSIASFAHHGIDVTAAPVAPQITVSTREDFSRWLPSIRALNASRSILKEYVGVLMYWSRGWL